MQRHRKLLIVLADGEHARFLRPAHHQSFETAAQFDSVTAHHRSSDLGADRPGATFHSGSTAHHGIAPRTDPHRHEKENFDHFIAEEVNKLIAAGAYDDLILVAPARALNAVREALDADAQSRVIGTVQKDLIKSSIRDVWSQVHHWIGVDHTLVGTA